MQTKLWGGAADPRARRIGGSVLSAIALATALAAAGPVLAQDALPAAKPAPAAVATPDAVPDTGAIVVTARLRTESLNKVPISVAALDGTKLAAHGQNDIASIATNIPTVEFRTGASNKDRDVFIRGVGTITTSPGVDPSVSTVIDGVVLARPGQATLDLMDIDRIEVLRGPQGTLFGKNASAGVINVVTKAPTNRQTEELEASYYQGDEYRFRGGVSGPIVADKLLYSITGLFANYDGNVRNITTGDEVNGYRRRGVRAKLLAKPSDNLTLTFGADYVYTHDTVPAGIYISSSRAAYPSGAVTANPTLAATLAGEGIMPSPDNRTVAQSFDTDVRDKNYGTSVQADLAMAGGYSLTSITAYRRWRNYQHQDYDGFAQPTTAYVQGEDYGQVHEHQFSQEVRIASPKGHLIDYVVGAYYMHVVNNEIYQRTITSVTPGVSSGSGTARYGTTSDDMALFGEANINLTSRARIIAGYRSIWDDLDYYHVRTASFATPGATSTTGIAGYHASRGTTDPHGNAYRVGAQYDLARDASAYFTYSRGYKGPAYNVYFNMLARDEGALKPETSNAYEIGLKGSAFDHRLQASVAGFITKFDNYQANVLDLYQGAQVSRLINAGKVSSKGVEGDLSARPIDPLALTFSFARTDAKIDQFNCPAGAAASCNINGEPLPFAPKWKLHGDATYTLRLSDAFSLQLDSDYSWQSETQYQLTETPDTIQPAYGIWNASIALIAKDGWQLRGLVKNIANKHYASYLGAGTLGGLVRFVPRDDDRYFGVIASAKF